MHPCTALTRKSAANETFGEMYGCMLSFQKEASDSGGSVTSLSVMVVCNMRLLAALAALAVRLVNRLVHRGNNGT
jgi:hypothetical protein